MNSKVAWALHAVLVLLVFTVAGLSTRALVRASVERLESGVTPAAGKSAPVASTAEEGYCTADLKNVLRRVLLSCGLIGGGRRGCEPAEVKNVAQISDEDFNALFRPLSKRGGVVLFDLGKDELDDGAKALLENIWADRRGASYFFVVARASTDGPTVKNRVLSHKRANSVLFYLQDRFQDPRHRKVRRTIVARRGVCPVRPGVLSVAAESARCALQRRCDKSERHCFLD